MKSSESRDQYAITIPFDSNISKEELIPIIQKHWGMKLCAFRSLIGFDNFNYYAKGFTEGESAKEYTIKVFSNLKESDCQILQVQAKILELLDERSRQSSYRQYPIAIKPVLSSTKGHEEFQTIILFSYLPGKLFGQFQQHGLYSEQLLIKISKQLSKLSNSLLTISQSQSNANLIQQLSTRNWEWKAPYFAYNVHQNRQIYITDSQSKENISYFVNYYKRKFEQIEQNKQKQGQLRKSIIYNDANEWNTVVGKQEEISFFDFRNLAYSYLVQESANLIAYLIYPLSSIDQIIQRILTIVQHYSQDMPLLECEVEMLLASAALRMSMSACNSFYTQAFDPDNSYAKSRYKNMLRCLKVLRLHLQIQSNEKLLQSKIHSVSKIVSKIQQQ